MNDQFYPDEEKRLAQDIDKALRPLDEEPSARIAPESIVSRLREEQAPRPLPFYRQKRWIAVLSSLAACVAVVIAAAAGGLLRTKDGGSLNVAPAASLSTSCQEDTAPSKTTEPVAGSNDKNAGGTATDGAATTVDFTDAPDAAQSSATQKNMNAAQSTAACGQATRPGGSERPTAGSGNSEGVAGEKPSDALSAALLSDAEAAQLTQDGALLVDVRSAEAYDTGHMDGAVHLSLDAIRQGEYGDLSAAAPLIIYGADAADGEAAALSLLAAGYRVEGYLSGYTT